MEGRKQGSPEHRPRGRLGARLLAAGVLLALLTACGGQPAETVADPPEPPVTTPAEPEPEPEPEPPPPPRPRTGVQAPLSGLRTDPSAFADRALAATIDNLRPARPQLGLQRADMVYEILAEGGITRFLAVWHRDVPPVIGPVRSARTYFVELAYDLDAYYAHVGQSPQAAVLLEALGAANLNELTGAGGFYRAPHRDAPHDAYLQTESAYRWAAAVGYREQADPPTFFTFPEDWEPEGEPATELSFAVNWGFDYRFRYEYDEDLQAYRRFTSGEPHVDEGTGEQLTVTNVIVQTVRTWHIPGDTEGRLDMELTGSGPIDIFSGGVRRSGTWERAGTGQPTVYRLDDGEPVTLLPGNVWIQVLPPDAEVDFGGMD